MKIQVPIKNNGIIQEKTECNKLPDSLAILMQKKLAQGILGLTDSEHEELITAYGNGKIPGSDDNPFQIGTSTFTGSLRKTLNLWKLIYDQAG